MPNPQPLLYGRAECSIFVLICHINKVDNALRDAKTITVLAKNRDGLVVDIDMRWGLIPASYTGFVESWEASTVNARLETVADLPSFQNAWALKRRVIIPVETYFQKVSTGVNVFGGRPAAKKVAITRADGRPLGVAGIYDHAKTIDGPVLSVASLTREPGPRMAKVHDREPVVVDIENWKAWLLGSDDLDLATPWADDAFELRPSR